MGSKYLTRRRSTLTALASSGVFRKPTTAVSRPTNIIVKEKQKRDQSTGNGRMRLRSQTVLFTPGTIHLTKIKPNKAKDRNKTINLSTALLPTLTSNTISENGPTSGIVNNEQKRNQSTKVGRMRLRSQSISVLKTNNVQDGSESLNLSALPEYNTISDGIFKKPLPVVSRPTRSIVNKNLEKLDAVASSISSSKPSTSDSEKQRADLSTENGRMRLRSQSLSANPGDIRLEKIETNKVNDGSKSQNLSTTSTSITENGIFKKPLTVVSRSTRSSVNKELEKLGAIASSILVSKPSISNSEKQTREPSRVNGQIRQRRKSVMFSAPDFRIKKTKTNEVKDGSKSLNLSTGTLAIVSSENSENDIFKKSSTVMSTPARGIVNKSSNNLTIIDSTKPSNATRTELKKKDSEKLDAVASSILDSNPSSSNSEKQIREPSTVNGQIRQRRKKVIFSTPDFRIKKTKPNEVKDGSKSLNLSTETLATLSSNTNSKNDIFKKPSTVMSTPARGIVNKTSNNDSTKPSNATRTELKKKDSEKLDAAASSILDLNSSSSNPSSSNTSSSNGEKRKRDERTLRTGGRLARRALTFIGPYNFNRKKTKTNEAQDGSKSFNVSTASTSTLTSNTKSGSEIFKKPTIAVSRPARSNIESNSLAKPSMLSEAITENSSLNKSKIPQNAINIVSSESKNYNLPAAASPKVNRSLANKVSNDKRGVNKSAATWSKNTRHLANGNYSQSRITNFFRPEGRLSEECKENNEPLTREDTIFGWATIGIDYIPYIVYKSEKYCSIRMINTTKSAKLLMSNSETSESKMVYDSFEPDEVQCRLLTEINREHCDFAYGRSKFNQNDLLVRLSDVEKFFSLKLCDYVRLTDGIGLDFGFILINDKSYIPYTIIGKEKVIPLFYLKCEHDVLDVLKSKAFTIPEKNELLLKFCCKYDGVSDEIFDKHPLEVIKFDELKKLSPPKTDYKDCWPTGDYQLRVVHGAKGLRLEHVKKIT